MLFLVSAALFTGASARAYQTSNSRDAYLLEVGKCPLAPSSKSECLEIAEVYGLPVDHVYVVNSASLPPGCYYTPQDPNMYYNSYPSASECTESRQCVCFESSVIAINEGNCDSFPADQTSCIEAAQELDMTYTSFTPTYSANLPAGCYYKPDSHALFYNTNKYSGVECSESRECLCYTDQN
eukprot:g73940.t1